MVVDFSKLNLKERQTLILKNQDGTYIQPLVFAHNLDAKLCYHEMSEITFEVPAYVDALKTPSYDDIVGMRLIDWHGIGQFVLTDPSTKNDGVHEVKECKAYSLEYELTYKQIFFENGTYNFWNPVAPENTVIGRILELLPSWSVGSVDASLIGKYRTFETSGENVYNFIKNTLQDTYKCIFDFDTYHRKMNVHAVSELVDTKPVYLSLDNLIKEITIDENTEDIFTCFDVTGADGVDIRSVNPLGTNKIYNLDYFMNATYFSQVMIDKWNAWKATYENSQKSYYSLTIEKTLKESQLVTEQAALVDLKGELSTLEEMQSVYVDAAAKGIDKSAEMAQVKIDIADKQAEISAKEAVIAGIKSEIERYTTQQKAINTSCAFEKFFNQDELTLLDRYIKESSISEDSFVYNEVASYSEDDISKTLTSLNISIRNAKIIKGVDVNGKDFYSASGGDVQLSGGDITIAANLISGAFEVATDGTALFTAYLDSGSLNGTAFSSGCISMTGLHRSISSDVKPDADIGGDYEEGTSLTILTNESQLFFTQNTTEYAKRSVEWDLLEYGQEKLNEACWPTYTFSIETANFLALDDFVAFKNQFALGSKIYLNLNGKIFTPIAVGAELNADDPTSFKLIFGDKYSLNDSAFKMVDLLDQSVSAGKSYDSKKHNIGSFIDSGANTALYQYINNALDAAKQAVMAGKNQSTVIDGSGIRCRYWNPTKNAFDDEQIWIINNNIVFTDNNWDTAKMAIGKTKSEDGSDLWGIVADAIVGKLIAGNNLIIEAMASDGTTVAFRVDGSGVQIHNGRFDMVRGSGQISLYPETGIVAGKATSSAPLYDYDARGNISGIRSVKGNNYTDASLIDFDDLPNANFWVDMDGNVYMKGKIYATDGQFNGMIYAKGGEFTGTVKAATLDGALTGTSNGIIKGVGINIGDGAFVVNRYGDTTIENGNFYAPYIEGDHISVDGLFAVEYSGRERGYIGPATGSTKNEETGEVATTYGIAMADSDTYQNGMIDCNTVGNYVIVTDAGLRLQSGSNRITVRDDGIWITVDNGSAWYNGEQLGTGTAKFG